MKRAIAFVVAVIVWLLVVAGPAFAHDPELDAIRARLDKIEAALNAPVVVPVTPVPVTPPAPPAPPVTPVSDRLKECAARDGMDMMWLSSCLGGRALTADERAYLREIKFPGAEPVATNDVSGSIDHESGSFDFWRPNSYRIFRATAGASQKTLSIPLAFNGSIRLATGSTSGNIANEVALTVFESGRVVFSAVIPVSYADPSFPVEGGKTYLIRMESHLPFAMTVRIEPVL